MRRYYRAVVSLESWARPFGSFSPDVEQRTDRSGTDRGTQAAREQERGGGAAAHRPFNTVLNQSDARHAEQGHAEADEGGADPHRNRTDSRREATEDLTPSFSAIEDSQVAQSASSRCNQARANVQSRFTVASDTPRTSAASSRLSPPKKRSSTNFP
jgi:hypothetical protein